MNTLVVFDQKVTLNSPAGSCVRTEVIGLLEHYKVVLFTSECDIPNNKNLDVRIIPLPKKPIVLRYVLFQFLNRVMYQVWRMSNAAPEAIQCTQGQFVGADISYPHFCHTNYLNDGWKKQTERGIRRLLRYCVHRFNSFFEKRAFHAASHIVCPSRGLAEELERTFPGTREKIRVIENPVDLDQFALPTQAEIDQTATRLGIDLAHLNICFVALGDFERKGLGILIEAIAALSSEQRPYIKVVGGNAGEIASFADRANRAGVAAHVSFAGLQKDIRPFLWCCDILCLLSTYEIFPLVVLQGAAAGKPILSTRVNGVIDFLEHGRNGWEVARSAEDLTALLRTIPHKKSTLNAMGQLARESVERFGKHSFVRKWVRVYADRG